MGAEFVRGRVCQGPSLLGAEMSRNPARLSFEYYRQVYFVHRGLQVESLQDLNDIEDIEDLFNVEYDKHQT